MERIKAFLDPSVDKLGASFQLNQSLIAVGSGGLKGPRGLTFGPDANGDGNNDLYVLTGSDLLT